MKRIDFFAGHGTRMAHSYSYATTSNAAMREKMPFHVSIFMSQGTIFTEFAIEDIAKRDLEPMLAQKIRRMGVRTAAMV